MLMGRTHIQAVLLALAMGAFLIARAAESPSTQPAGENGRARDPLATKQQIVRDRMTQLEDRMFRLTEKLSQTEPEQAKKLQAAMKRAQELLVRRNMDEAVELLESGKLTDAADRQGTVVKGLEGVLKILMEEGDNTKERQLEIDKLKEYQDQVRRMLDNERQLKSQADASRRLTQLRAGIQAAIKELESLVAKEEGQVEKSAKAAPADQAAEAGKLSEEQKTIREDTETLSKALENPGADAQAANAETSPPKEAPGGTAPPSGKPGDGESAQGKQTGKPDQAPRADGPAPKNQDAGNSAAPKPNGRPATPPGGDSRSKDAQQGKNGDPSQPGPDSKQASKEDSVPSKGKEKQGEEAVEKGVREAQNDVSQAGQQMKSAENQLREKDVAEALPMQKKSVESLKRALQELKKQEQEARKQLDQAEAARKQRELQREAEKMAERMKSGQGPGDDAKGDQPKGGKPQGGDPQFGKRQDGKQSDGQKQDGQPQDGQQGSKQDKGQQQNQRPEAPVPGNQSVERAGQHMEKAAEDLDQNKPEQASPNQQQAIEQLEQAQKSLEEALDQLRREQQEEILRGLESRFRAMLAQQLIINEGTTNLDKKGQSSWEHADELKLASLTQDQNTVADQAGQSLHILKEEGTTVVFPRIVEQMREDMTAVAALLHDSKTGARTQRMQEEIVNTLKELTEAIKDLRKKIQNGEAGGNQGQQGQNGQQAPPLLPGSAELRLLRSCQQRVSRETTDFNQDHADRSALDTEGQARLQHIAGRQQEVAEMARKMNERLTGQ